MNPAHKNNPWQVETQGRIKEQELEILEQLFLIDSSLFLLQ
ncbi:MULTISPECIES: hypothetical protein [Sphaerochaeta]|jgi:hypothetical protein|nr:MULTISPECIES: hypothetical protein [Sphaerochaeta]MDD3423924.1 hypothetical protein [Sphaerochaeta sp.]MDD3456453.1 hypothetical protein [Sphaerochaeta sp.]MEA5028197.1 hypothetical protein [Sphaerochaeta associata]MEA5106860.1 hypothetical protein [Sphaerochaeta associata]